MSSDLIARIDEALKLGEWATSGPWEVGTEDNGAPGYIYCDNELGSAVAIAYGKALPFQVFRRAEVMANAALIAAAPSLLDLLAEARRALASQE